MYENDDAEPWVWWKEKQNYLYFNFSTKNEVKS